MSFKEKYLKYKKKYLDTKKLIGGSILEKYKETGYISKNKKIQELVQELEEGKIEIIDEIQNFVKENNWKAFDKFILDNKGKENFFIIFQQLFMFYYFTKEISRKQFQNALGIQQVRWMVDLENECREVPNYIVYSAELHMWEEIEKSEQTLIKNQIYDEINMRIYPHILDTTNPTNLNGHYQNSIWYKLDIKGNMSWPGFGTLRNYYSIPETMNFSKIACIYTPVLIFGSLSEQSLLKYIINNKQRPYAMHAPNVKSNLSVIHGLKHIIVANWRHDFIHSRSGICDKGFRYISKYTKFDLDEKKIMEEINKTDSDLNLFLNTPHPSFKVGALNDTGSIWSDDGKVPVMEGGNFICR